MRQPHETMAESSLASDDDHEFISGSDMDSAEHYGSDGGPMESHGDAGMTTASEDDDTASEDDVADPRFAMDDSFEDSFANDARSNGDDANDADGVPANTSSSSSPTTTTTTTSPHRPLDAAALQSFRADNDATGVVYMSRVPPKMKPQKVRHLLQQFGEVRRIYLAAEGGSVRTMQ